MDVTYEVHPPLPPPEQRAFGAEIVGEVMDVTYEDFIGVYRVRVTGFDYATGWHQVRSHGVLGLWDGEEFTDIIDVSEMHAKGNISFVAQKVRGRPPGRGKLMRAAGANARSPARGSSAAVGVNAVTTPSSSSNRGKHSALASAAVRAAAQILADAGAGAGAADMPVPCDAGAHAASSPAPCDMGVGASTAPVLGFTAAGATDASDPSDEGGGDSPPGSCDAQGAEGDSPRSLHTSPPADGTPPAECTELVGISPGADAAASSRQQRCGFKRRGRKLLARRLRKPAASLRKEAAPAAPPAGGKVKPRGKAAMLKEPAPAPPPPPVDDVEEPEERVVFGADLCGHVVDIVHRNVRYTVRVVRYEPKGRKHFVSSFGLNLEAGHAFGDREVDLNRLFTRGQLSLAGRSDLGTEADHIEGPRGRGGRFSEFKHPSNQDSQKVLLSRAARSLDGAGGPADALTEQQRHAASSATTGPGSLKP